MVKYTIDLLKKKKLDELKDIARGLKKQGHKIALTVPKADLIDSIISVTNSKKSISVKAPKKPSVKKSSAKKSSAKKSSAKKSSAKKSSAKKSSAKKAPKKLLCFEKDAKDCDPDFCSDTGRCVKRAPKFQMKVNGKIVTSTSKDKLETRRDALGSKAKITMVVAKSAKAKSAKAKSAKAKSAKAKSAKAKSAKAKSAKAKSAKAKSAKAPLKKKSTKCFEEDADECIEGKFCNDTGRCVGKEKKFKAKINGHTVFSDSKDGLKKLGAKSSDIKSFSKNVPSKKVPSKIASSKKMTLKKSEKINKFKHVDVKTQCYDIGHTCPDDKSYCNSLGKCVADAHKYVMTLVYPGDVVKLVYGDSEDRLEMLGEEMKEIGKIEDYDITDVDSVGTTMVLAKSKSIESNKQSKKTCVSKNDPIICDDDEYCFADQKKCVKKEGFDESDQYVMVVKGVSIVGSKKVMTSLHKRLNVNGDIDVPVLIKSSPDKSSVKSSDKSSVKSSDKSSVKSSNKSVDHDEIVAAFQKCLKDL